ncbi:MAG: AMP-binding protein, partial [Anaerolineae bacterium]|nr:AMP-binding protein [Anaerolineae bacterium]
MAESQPDVQANIHAARSVRGIPSSQPLVPCRSLGELVALRARETPDQDFLIYYNDDTGEHSQYTYAQFARRVAQVAHFLKSELGIGRGDCLATVSINHPDTVFIYFACWSLGAVVAPQNVTEADERLAFILENAEAHVALVRPEYHERLLSLQARVPTLERLVVLDDAYHQALDAQPDIFATPAEDLLAAPCLIVYTSGTTGAPKGVELVQYNLLADALGIVEWHGVTPDQRFM